MYITRALAPDAKRFAGYCSEVFRARWFTNDGPLVRQLEERLQIGLGVGFCTAFSNGTTALQAALRFLDLSGEVITTPFTFPATVHAIQWNGLTPVFCDIDPDTYNLDTAKAEELISDRTSALVPVHVFGNPCDLAGLRRLAERHDVRILYDAAHAFGVSADGIPIGCFGDLSIFSFHATKIFHTAEGGAVVGSESTNFSRLRLLRNFGIVSENEVSGVGVNGKLSEVHAALGLSVLDAAKQEISARAPLASAYAERLSDVEGLGQQRFRPGTERNHAYCSIEVDPDRFGLSRDDLQRALRAENIMTRRYFSPLCSENESYRGHPSAQPECLPNARRLSDRILCLPLYGEFGKEGVERCLDAVAAIHECAPRIRLALRGAEA